MFAFGLNFFLFENWQFNKCNTFFFLLICIYLIIKTYFMIYYSRNTLCLWNKWFLIITIFKLIFCHNNFWICYAKSVPCSLGVAIRRNPAWSTTSCDLELDNLSFIFLTSSIVMLFEYLRTTIYSFLLWLRQKTYYSFKKLYIKTPILGKF